MVKSPCATARSTLSLDRWLISSCAIRSIGIWGVDMITHAEIAEHLNFLLDGAISLDDFEDWIAVRSWNMHADSSDESQKLAWAVELNLSEYSSGHLDEAELRGELKSSGSKRASRR